MGEYSKELSGGYMVKGCEVYGIRLLVVKMPPAGAVSMLCPAVRQGAIHGILLYMPIFLSLAS